LFILGTNQNLSLVIFKNKQITKQIQKTKNNKNATALMYSKFINNLEQTMDFLQKLKFSPCFVICLFLKKTRDRF
jgi:hypothetical protein